MTVSAIETQYQQQREKLVSKARIDSENLVQTVKLKAEDVRKVTHNIYVIVCILIIFISLYFLNGNRFLFSTFIVLGISLLHFKSFILELLNHMIEMEKLGC